MTKCYLDSNVLIYWTNELAPLHTQANATIDTLQKNRIDVYLSSLVLDEFLHATLLRARLNHVKDPYVDGENALQRVLNIPYLSLINPPTDTRRHVEIISLMKTYSLRPRDAYHLLTMLSGDVDTFATFDNDFRKVFASKLLVKA